MSEESIPAILESAWNVCTPSDEPLKDQIAPLERQFLIKYAEYITSACADKNNLDFKEKEALIDDIMKTGYTRLTVLVKQVTPAITHAVMAVVLYLLSNILNNDHVKYKKLEDMLETYPCFKDRPENEKQNLFLTANWMAVLFRVIPARKNKGIAMDIIPKFVEGNDAHYVTGGGQKQATRDRVHIYETEGGCKPIKRLKRKSKTKLQEEEEEEAAKAAARQIESLGGAGPPSKKVGLMSPPSITRDNTASSINNYFPLPAPFFQAQPLPIPAISPRSQSSFSQAAAAIASFGQFQPQTQTSSTASGANGYSYQEGKSSNYVVSPKECYVDIGSDGKAVNKTSNDTGHNSNGNSLPLNRAHNSAELKDKANPTTSPYQTLQIPEGSLSSLPPSLARMSSTGSTFDKFVSTITVDANEDGDPLAMLREVSADSDI